MNKTPSLVLSFLNCRRMMYATVPGLALTSCMLVDNAIAQITVDGTTSTTITPTENSIRIEGGDTAGSNLFHSFQDFSVTNGTEAFFNNGSNIENIFSRVTGGNVSNIDGLIRANNANLFLINPTGILFGAGASLDLGGGSFYGSTADSILFPEGEFNATENPSEPILIVNAPIGLRFRDEPASIETNNAEPITGANINLLGGDIKINSRLFGSKTLLGGLKTAGVITLRTDNTIEFPDNISQADVILDGGFLGVFSNNGFIDVRANNLILKNNSLIIANETNEINLTAADSITLQDGSLIISQVVNNSGLDAGNININAGNQVNINTGSLIFNQVEADGVGNAGNINIRSKNKVNINGLIFNRVRANGRGNSGDINIKSDTIVIDNTSIISEIQGIGDTGDITLDSSNKITLSNNTLLTNRIANNSVGNTGKININSKSIDIINNSIVENEIGQGAIGNTGNINITTDNLLLYERSFIIAENSGAGDLGNILINASESVVLDNDLSQLAEDEIELAPTSRIFNTLQETGTGSGGDLIINTKDFDLRNRSRIFVETQGFGDAGKLTINADNKVSLTGTSEISSSAINIKSQGKGDAGDIEINTQVLEIDDGSIFSFLQGNGNAGNITINAIERVTLDALNDRGFATTQLNTAVLFDRESGTISRGNGGDIEVNTKNLDLKNGAAITANTLGEGDGGNIFINATETVNLTEGSIIRNDIGEIAIGDGGSIRIDTKVLDVNGGSIFSLVRGQGNAENITINATEKVVLDRMAQINAQAQDSAVGDAGDILIDTRSLELDGKALILANSSGLGDAGQIIINPIANENLNVALGGNSEISVEANTNINLAENNQIDAGKITITADNLSLNNSLINAQNVSGEGGNIELSLSDRLSLTNNSTISARAGNNAMGGNINIDARFIIAQPNQNSDILANASQGKGGDITINAQGIFGIQERKSTPPNFTNDIDASSEVKGSGGNVSINLPDINPIKGAADVPSNIVSADIVTANACSVGQDNNSAFVIENRVGTPHQSNEPLTADIIQSTQSAQINNQIDSQLSQKFNPIHLTDKIIYPARGVVIQPDGTVTLTPYSTNNLAFRIPSDAKNCH